MSFNTSGSIAGNGFNGRVSSLGFVAVSGRCAEILLSALLFIQKYCHRAKLIAI